jgi:molecular chaperone GrpE
MDRQTEPLRRKAAAVPDADAAAGHGGATEPEAAGSRAAGGGGPVDGNPPDEAGDAAARSGDAQAEAGAEAGVEAEAGAEAGSGSGAETGEEQPAARQEEDPRVQEWYNRYLRVQADFENYRRRTQREKEEFTRYASMKLIGELLPVLDNFERALQAIGKAEKNRLEEEGRAEGPSPGAGQAEFESFRKGVDMIYRQLVQVLEADGLKAMEPVGQPFDPNLHQAVMQVSSDEYEEGIVVEVLQKGYWLKDKVLRPALVKVSG